MTFVYIVLHCTLPLHARVFSSKLEFSLTIEEEIRTLAKTYAETLKKQIDKRVVEMNSDDDSHFLIYQVLGVSDEEGRLIDIYQNKGRFLYKYAGSFLENAAKACHVLLPEPNSSETDSTDA